ncbi:hypothetical protein PQX77_021213 [Marasmius sp. AFHP31]|nr:hypothetical protein PQX77_021213 [Marasmius sp. AFHP31]
MPRASTKRSKADPDDNTHQTEKLERKARVPASPKRYRIFVPSLLPEHRIHIKGLLFTEFYEFFHNDMVPEGINWIFHQLQCHLPEFALYIAGSVTEVEEVNRVRKEDIRMAIYKEMRDVFTMPNGVWTPTAPIRVLDLQKQISLEDYMAAGTHSMRWWYKNSNVPRDDYLSKDDAEETILLYAPNAFYTRRVRRAAKNKCFYLRALYLTTFES